MNVTNRDPRGGGGGGGERDKQRSPREVTTADSEIEVLQVRMEDDNPRLSKIFFLGLE